MPKCCPDNALILLVLLASLVLQIEIVARMMNKDDSPFLLVLTDKAYRSYFLVISRARVDKKTQDKRFSSRETNASKLMKEGFNLIEAVSIVVRT